MKHFQDQNFLAKEDIQIQVPTARLGFAITLLAGTNLDDIVIRTRLAGVDGTKTTIEKVTLKRLFEIAASEEGFYTITHDTNLNVTYVTGHVLISRKGALRLNNSRYLSMDVDAGGKTIGHLEVHSMSHPTLTDTYLKYNQVTINQSVQSVPVDTAVQVVLPISKVDNVQMQYPDNNVEYSRRELGFLGELQNDLVWVNLTEGTLRAGYDDVVVLDLVDTLSATRCSKLQIEGALAASQFNVLLIEEHTS